LEDERCSQKKYAMSVRKDVKAGYLPIAVRIERDYTRNQRADAPSEAPGGSRSCGKLRYLGDFATAQKS
jgi:hypothetical protein